MAVLNSTDSSNLLPLVKSGKCLGCKETPKDTDVLHCFLCKSHFHVVNCTVAEALRGTTVDSEVLPSNTNLINYSKFSSKIYTTGSFIWTCFRCGVIKEMSCNNNIDQRVAVLESILITLSPALSALTKSSDTTTSQGIAKMLSEIRAGTPVITDGCTTGATDDCTPGVADGNPLLEVSSSESELPPTDSLPSSENAAVTPNASGESCMDLDPMSAAYAGERNHHHIVPKSKVTQFKVRVTSDKEKGPPLRATFHRAHATGKIGSYSIRYHSNNKADFIFDNLSDAKSAYQSLTTGIDGIDVSDPTCMNTKMVHIVGLTEDDTNTSIYDAICKPGRNRAIEHLVNPCTLRVASINPCNKTPHVYRASVVVAEEIWDIILNKMNSKVKVDYLSCSVFLRPDSIRCYNCQKLGHTSKTCQNDIKCVVCGEGHNSKGCVNTPKCINCFDLGLDSNHRADSANCAAYKNFRNGSAKK